VKEERVRKAMQVASEFLDAAGDLIDTDKATYEICGNKESGTLRRKSMDLTRALADMRRP
jgi:hypothetical protein